MIRFCVVLRCSNFRALGLDPAKTYTEQEVKAAYRAQAKALHPDVTGGSDATKFRAVHAAYQAVTGRGPSGGAGNASSSSYAASTSGSTTKSHAVGDEQVYGARKPYADMYAQWYPEQTAAETTAAASRSGGGGKSSSHGEDLKWYTFGSGRTTTTAEEAAAGDGGRDARRDFYNPYGGAPSGQRGFDRDDANASTKDFYREYSHAQSAGYTASEGGYTQGEINQMKARNQLLMLWRRGKRLVMVGAVVYIWYLMTLSPTNKARILQAEKKSGAYSADYLNTLPDNRTPTPYEKPANANPPVRVGRYSAFAGVSPKELEEGTAKESAEGSKPKKVVAVDYDKAAWDDINNAVMAKSRSSGGQNQQPPQQQQQQPVQIVDQSRPYAMKFRGKAFTAEGLEQLREERKTGKKATSSNNGMVGDAAALSPSVLVAQHTAIGSSQLPPALRERVQGPSHGLDAAEADDMSYDIDD